MHILLLAAAAAIQAAPTPQTSDAPAIAMRPAPLPAPQQAALRCSVAVAIAAEQQRVGKPADANWPDLRERGREFFVRSLAQLMDDTGYTRESLTVHGRLVAEELQEPGRLEEIMPACLLMLDASGL